MPIQYKTLGKTGLLVSNICLGTMTFGDGQGVYHSIGAVDQSDANALVKTAFSAGVNFFDTADVYSLGKSESTLGQAIKDLGIARREVVLATKVFMRVGKGVNDVGASRGHILDAVEDSLRRLQTNHIDLYQIHASDALTPIDETLAALDLLVRQGKVRYIGCSNWQGWKLARALGIAEAKGYAPFNTIQAYYSLAGRDVEREIVPLLEAERVGMLVWSPLAGGLLSGKYSRETPNPEGARRSGFDFPIVDKERAWNVIDVLKQVARAHECSPARVALAWLLARPVVTSVLIGARKADQLQDNIAAVDLSLTADEIKQLDEVSALPQEYPGWMVDVQNSSRLSADTNMWADYSN